MKKMKTIFARIPKKILGLLLIAISFWGEFILFLQKLFYPHGEAFFKSLSTVSTFPLIFIFLVVFLIFFLSCVLTLSRENYLKNTAQFFVVGIIIFVVLAHTFINEGSVVYYPTSY